MFVHVRNCSSLAPEDVWAILVSGDLKQQISSLNVK